MKGRVSVSKLFSHGRVIHSAARDRKATKTDAKLQVTDRKRSKILHYKDVALHGVIYITKQTGILRYFLTEAVQVYLHKNMDKQTSFSWAFLLSLKLYIGGRPLPRFLITAGGWLLLPGSEGGLEYWSAGDKSWESTAEVSCSPRASDKQSGAATAELDSMLHNTDNLTIPKNISKWYPAAIAVSTPVAATVYYSIQYTHTLQHQLCRNYTWVKTEYT